MPTSIFPGKIPCKKVVDFLSVAILVYGCVGDCVCVCCILLYLFVLKG